MLINKMHTTLGQLFQSGVVELYPSLISSGRRMFPKCFQMLRIHAIAILQQNQLFQNCNPICKRQWFTNLERCQRHGQKTASCAIPHPKRMPKTWPPFPTPAQSMLINNMHTTLEQLFRSGIVKLYTFLISSGQRMFPKCSQNVACKDSHSPTRLSAG